MSGRLTYVVRVDLVDGYEIVELEAATIAEALQRASNIWCGGEVRLVGTIDRAQQKALVFA